MSNTRELKISNNAKLVRWDWENYPTEVELVYIEHSTDHWYSDRETEVDISKEKAIEIVEFLIEAFNLNGCSDVVKQPEKDLKGIEDWDDY